MCKKLFLLTSFVLVFGLVVNASGQVLQEVWENIGGTAVSDLTNNANYPDNPTWAALLPDMKVTDFADNYGSRLSGYLQPATSGDCTFWIAADDGCALFLSTDDDPANALQICGHNSWTGIDQFDNMPEQMSAPVALEAGGKYYIAALYKEGGGGDNCSVAWQGPDSPDRAILGGAFMSPAAIPPSLMKAQKPDPADGAVDVDTVSLAWEAGYAAVSHVVYLNGELIAETDQLLAFAVLDPGTAYTWQVNEIQEDGTVIEGSVWSFTTLPLEAHFPSPADAAENVASPVTLKWTVGKNTIINDVYFGTDEAAIAARDMSTFKGKLMTPSYNAGALELFSTYYWAVDEFTPGGTVAGPVWSFSTEKYISLLSGTQTLNYDNTAEPYVSELALDTPADLTAEGVVSDLTLSFKGAAANLSIDEATGTYQIAGAGADVWGGTDEFHYVYMQLTGDGEISARVVSNGTGSNTWAKGGVMIRESTAGNSAQMLMAMTSGDGGGICFQGRSVTGSGTSTSYHGTVIASPPYWVKLTREGNAITAYASADGETWDLFTCAAPDGAHTNPMDVAFPETVLIGLFVTSHAAGEARTYTFDNVDIQGDLDGVIVSEDIDSVSGNTADPIYVALEDATGAVAVVAHPYAAATQLTVNRPWAIPLSAFEGVDPTAAAKVYIGVGNGEAGGVGSITVSNVRVVEPIGMADVTAPGDIVQGVPNDGLMDGDNWGWPGAEHPALAIDDNVNTKFLHFRGDLMPTGIRVTPLNGPSVVTGLSFTTANDSPERDPIAFALYGSNSGIDGKYDLIACGDIVDFDQEVACDRFTKNATPITFDNDVAYAHYEVLFLDVRNAGGSNSMQIAEIELLSD
jgi:hypothetical protein